MYVCDLQGFFKASPWFFLAHTVHVLLMEVLAIFVLWYFGTSWLPWLTALVLISAMQAQAGWLQHDFGHLTVCSTSKWNHILHYSIVNFWKGASSYWWNRRHFQHHTKPNVVSVHGAAFTCLLSRPFAHWSSIAWEGIVHSLKACLYMSDTVCTANTTRSSGLAYTSGVSKCQRIVPASCLL